MHLRPDWKKILRHAWSIRLMLAAAVLSGLEVALPYLESLPIPSGVFGFLALAVSVTAPVARLIAQKPLSGDPE